MPTKPKKKKFIIVDSGVAKTTPKVFKQLSGTTQYRLQKIGAKRASMVSVLQYVEGTCSVVAIKLDPAEPKCAPGIKVEEPFGLDYIRTSPITRVLLATKKNIVFETEGGFYELTTLK
jgi:arginase family enzyme